MRKKYLYHRLLLSFLTLFTSQLLAKDVLTATPVTYMLATKLMQGTPITTTYLAPKRYGIERLNNWYAGRGETVIYEAAQAARVVITLKALWPDDALFNYAREGNINLIEIDASQSISPAAKGIATVRLPDGGQSLYAWLNPNNLGTMISIVGQDLQRVWPEYAALIKHNQQQLLVNIRLLINQQQQILFDKEIDSVVLLSDQLEDFSAANQLFVEHRLLTAELEWSEQEIASLQKIVMESPHLWILTNRKVSKQLADLLPHFSNILIIDTIDRWGAKGVNLAHPLQRWLF
ncbi:ABC transporter substrate-binding protein [Psychromonas marina]|uniref:ABC transporter substrate-binding protein n=1 Tax=Psychromonas marina TaxID=88364 RepID=A0ABQ6E3D1_9GAMM|nr:ABC transporter substrate-binding protein [Psychromonas marina]GLS91892.1 ABC transporter substrate-binding protein [Psychromonas marina]